MTHIYFGCDETPRGWKRYLDLCNAYEVRADGAQPPSMKTLNSWRVSTPKGFCFVLHAGDELSAALEGKGWGEDGLSAPAEEAWAQVLERRKALAAKAVLVRTSPDFTPTPEHRARLVALSARAAADKVALIWESSGLWEATTTYEWAQEHGIVYAFDPFLATRDGLEIEGNGQDVCFALSERAGMRRTFDEYELEQLMDWCEGHQRAFVLLRGRHKFAHAREIKYLLSQSEG